MYAVIESGGKQYRVAVGDVVRVEKLALAAGASVNLDKVLLIADNADVRVGSPLLAETKVTAMVKGHGRGEKIRIFKTRRRKHFRKHAGHRQDYTELEIVDIAGHRATKDQTSPNT
ncbi:MAG TPA: 50S ribosomal protein L21 [Acidiferrobacterales bacterium]|nr:50S ribosomal protein L21 [Acidiferrobacterales bacterium]